MYCSRLFTLLFTSQYKPDVHGSPRQQVWSCRVGAQSVYGRPLAEAHLDACMKCGLKISGINAEVMPGQWEFQIGPAGALEMPDQVRRCAMHSSETMQHGMLMVEWYAQLVPSTIFIMLCAN